MNIYGVSNSYQDVKGTGNYRIDGDELDLGTKNDEDVVFIRNDVEIAELNSEGQFEVKGDLKVDGKIIGPGIGDIVNGGQTGPVIIGTTDNTEFRLIQYNDEIIKMDGGQIEIAQPIVGTQGLTPFLWNDNGTTNISSPYPSTSLLVKPNILRVSQPLEFEFSYNKTVVSVNERITFRSVGNPTVFVQMTPTGALFTPEFSGRVTTDPGFGDWSGISTHVLRSLIQDDIIQIFNDSTASLNLTIDISGLIPFENFEVLFDSPQPTSISLSTLQTPDVGKVRIDGLQVEPEITALKTVVDADEKKVTADSVVIGDWTFCKEPDNESLGVKNITYNPAVQSNLTTAYRNIALNYDGKLQYAIRLNAQVRFSEDGGETFNVLPNSPFDDFVDITCDESGRIVYVLEDTGIVYRSFNFGAFWEQVITPASDCNFIACSRTGQYVYFSSSTGGTYLSTDFGISFTFEDVDNTGLITDTFAIGVSLDGSHAITGVTSAGNFYVTQNFGGTWSQQAISGDWGAAGVSQDGRYMYISQIGGLIYKSEDFGVTFLPTSAPSLTWRDLECNNTGRVIVANASSPGSSVWLSTDYGETWAAANGSPNAPWLGIDLSYNGCRFSSSAGSAVGVWAWAQDSKIADFTCNRILNISEPVQLGDAATKNYVDTSLQSYFSADVSQPTGIISGGDIIQNTATTFNIESGEGIVNFNGVVTRVTWNDKNNISTVPGTPQNAILIDKDGDLVILQQTPTASEIREYILLGGISLVGTNIQAIVTDSFSAVNVGASLVDLAESLGVFNTNGNVFSANGTNLNIDKTAGSIFSLGSNFQTNPNSPNIVQIPQAIAPIFLRFTQTGATASSNEIDSLNYDVGGVVTLIPGGGPNSYTVQRIYIAGSGQIVVEYGQTTYATLTDAKNGIGVDPHVSILGPTLLLRCFLILARGTVDLSDPLNEFVEAGKFGSNQTTTQTQSLLGTGGFELIEAPVELAESKSRSKRKKKKKMGLFQQPGQLKWNPEIKKLQVWNGSRYETVMSS